METLRFVNDDRMPVLGLGTWKAGPGEVGAAVKEAIRIGYRHIDCAAIYGNEAEIGVAVEQAIESGLVRRDELWITSKLWNNAHARAQVVPALQQTLNDLRLDYLDLYLVHWPVAIRPDVVFPTGPEDFLSLEEVSLGETWEGMEECVEKGLARHIGVSNFRIGHLEEVIRSASVQPEMNQVEMHPYLQQDDLLQWCHRNGIHVTAYSPLGSGDRPAALKKSNELSLLGNDTVVAIAVSLGCTTAQVLIRWAIERGAAVIPKSTNPERLAENLAASKLKLSPADMSALAELEAGFRYVHGEFWTMEGSPYSLESLWGA